MSTFLYNTEVTLRTSQTGLVTGVASTTLGYKLHDRSGTVVQGFTYAGVTESTTLSVYYVTGGMPLPVGFAGTIRWYIGSGAAHSVAEEAVDFADTGLDQLQVTVEDAAHNAVVGAQLALRSADGTLRLRSAVTDGQGRAVLVVSAGVYLLLVASGGNYLDWAPRQVTVAGDTSYTVTLEPGTVSPPSMPGLCVVSGYVRHPVGGALLNGAKVSARLVAENAAADTAILSRQQGTVVSGDAEQGWPSGYFELQLVRSDYITKGSPVYALTITTRDGTICLQCTVTIPAQASITLDALLTR